MNHLGSVSSLLTWLIFHVHKIHVLSSVCIHISIFLSVLFLLESRGVALSATCSTGDPSTTKEFHDGSGTMATVTGFWGGSSTDSSTILRRGLVSFALVGGSSWMAFLLLSRLPVRPIPVRAQTLNPSLSPSLRPDLPPRPFPVPWPRRLFRPRGRRPVPHLPRSLPLHRPRELFFPRPPFWLWRQGFWKHF